MLSPEVLSRVEAYVAEQFNHAKVPGLAVAVAVEGEILLARAYGTADLASGTPATTETAFEIGSITKSMTATAILQLRDRGLLDLDDPVRRHLPWFRVGHGKESDQITVRHLLCHASGLPTKLTYLVMEYPDSAEAAGRALVKERLQSKPGAKFAYANIGYTLLGLIVEALSGRPWAEYVQHEILDPLGMAHSRADYRAGQGLDMTTPYAWQVGVRRLIAGWLRHPSMAAAGSLTVCSAKDLVRYGAFHLGYGPRDLLSEASLEEAHTGLVDAGPGVRYALGWVDQRSKSGERVVWHNGGTEGSTACLMLNPTQHVAVAVLVNSQSLATDRICAGVLEILAGKAPGGAKGDPIRYVSLLPLFPALIGLVSLVRLALAVAGGTAPSLVWALARAGAAWLLIAWLLPHLGQAPPVRLFGRWPAELRIGAVLMLLATTLWALYALLV